MTPYEENNEKESMVQLLYSWYGEPILNDTPDVLEEFGEGVEVDENNHFDCPNCYAGYTIRTQMSAMDINCKNCGQKIHIPYDEEE